MKKNLLFLTAASIFTLSACGQKELIKAPTIPVTDMDEYAGADSYGGSGDNTESMFYRHPDFYNLTSTESLTIISKFETMQQTTEWSCGPASALMVLNQFNDTSLTESDIAVAMTASTDEDVENAQPGSANNYHEYGTNVTEIYNFFNNLEGYEVVESSYDPNRSTDDIMTSDHPLATPSTVGNYPATFSSSSLYASENSDTTEAWVEDAKDSYFVKWLTSHLKAGRPIMVEWADWDGHWVSIIGYENNNTPSIADDTLIFADPYDTSDHWQDGYTTAPLESFFYMWKDRNVAPQPYQLQPYVIVDKK